MKMHPRTLMTLAALLVLSFTLPLAAQSPDGDALREQQLPDASSVATASGPQRNAEGLWIVPPGGAQSLVTTSAPSESGGPDDFGYAWNSTTLDWIDASGGADIAGSYADIGFSFKFYENTYSTAYVSKDGLMGFSSAILSAWQQGEIPSREEPDAVIAPHWSPANQSFGYVRYLRGGTEPNRWFLVKWNLIRSTGGDEATFEAILHENGDIVFQYGAMNRIYYCEATGIEDSRGLDGLPIWPLCDVPPSNTAVWITRPPASARAALWPRNSGTFAEVGGVAQHSLTVWNTGEFGSDTFNISAETNWPAAFYQADAVTPLADTNDDGIPDTGSIAPAASAAFVVRLAVPASVDIGDADTAQIHATSLLDPTKVKTAHFQSVVPAPFVQTYTQSETPKIAFHRPTALTTHLEASTAAYNPVVATAPNGNIVQVWRGSSRTNSNGVSVSELRLAVWDSQGNLITPARPVDDLSSAVLTTQEWLAAVAISSDGRIGVIWERRIRDSSNNYNRNILFQSLAADGVATTAPVNLTNNAIFGPFSGDPNVPAFYNPAIAAAKDGRFIMAWTSRDPTSNYMTWYAIRSSDGSAVKSPAQFSTARTNDLNLLALADSTVMLVETGADNLRYVRLTSTGSVVAPSTVLPLGQYSYPHLPDAAQVANGNIVLAWQQGGDIRYAILDAALASVKPPTILTNPWSTADDNYVTVTPSGGRAVLTWGDDSFLNSSNLYYALLDGAGEVITPPMIFVNDYISNALLLPDNGQGATHLIDLVSGRVTNNRGEPVSGASVTASPPPINIARTDANGDYSLTFSPGPATSYTFTANHMGYGALPPRTGVQIATATAEQLDFVLPPAQDSVLNGGWEGGTTSWQLSALPEFSVEVTGAAAHSGASGLRITATSLPGEPVWLASQDIDLPADMSTLTLSWLYRGAGLVVSVTDGIVENTWRAPAPAEQWTHGWMDLGGFAGETVTIKIGFQGASAALGPANTFVVDVDEISLGEAGQANYATIYLPVILR